MQAVTTPGPAAGRIIGRRPCPWCGFAHSHVKQKEGGHPYHYCPNCGGKTLTRNPALARLITTGMKPEPNYSAPPQLARRADDIVLPAQAVAEFRKPAGPWDQLLNLFNVPRSDMSDTTNTKTPMEQLREAAANVDENTLHVSDLARCLVAAVAVIEAQQGQLEQLLVAAA